MSTKRFKPVTPKDAAAHVAKAVSSHHALTVTEYKEIGSFFYTCADMTKGVTHARFKVDGALFVRRVEEEQIGNWGVRWVRILGVRYQLVAGDR